MNNRIETIAIRVRGFWVHNKKYIGRSSTGLSSEKWIIFTYNMPSINDYFDIYNLTSLIDASSRESYNQAVLKYKLAIIQALDIVKEMKSDKDIALWESLNYEIPAALITRSHDNYDYYLRSYNLKSGAMVEAKMDGKTDVGFAIEELLELRMVVIKDNKITSFRKKAMEENEKYSSSEVDDNSEEMNGYIKQFRLIEDAILNSGKAELN